MPLRRTGCGGSSRDVRRDIVCVPADSTDQHGRERVQERQANEVQTRRRRHNATRLFRPPVRASNRNMDPTEVFTESGAPDDVGNVQDLAVGEQWLAVPHADCACFDAFYTRGQ
jgi:hypothetical protein